MATAEPASTAGPRYAPEDPTLPKPWMGLIDGSTGLLYYWNPETNITQYEKPASFALPLPSSQGPPTPKLAPLPVSSMTQMNGNQDPQRQPVAQMSSQQPQGQSMLTQQQSTQIGQSGQQQQGQQSLAQNQQFLQHMMHHPGQQVPQQFNPQMPYEQMIQQGNPPQQPGQQMPQHQGSQVPQSQGHHMQQQPPYMAYQQVSHHQPQSMPQVHPSPSQPEYKGGYPKREDPDFQQGNQVGYSPSQIPRTGGPYPLNVPAGTISSPMGSHASQSQQFGVSLVNMQQPQPSPMGQPQQSGPIFVQHSAPRFQSHMVQPMHHGQQQSAPSVGMKIGSEENPLGRAGNDYYPIAKKEMPDLVSPHPKLASIPIVKNQQQDPRMDRPPFHNAPPGQASGFNPLPGHGMPNPYNAPPFIPNARPPSLIHGPSDGVGLSVAEAYRQQHEVTASGDNVPAPFMTFEATGFPPEILRELHHAGFASPTPIQAQTWPIALQSRDIVATAKTGSGKTLGYLIPAFILLNRRRNNPLNGPTVLVLAPTRELATQIQEEAIKFGRSSRFSCTCLYGGAQKGPQLKELDRGTDIVVATPGRLNDILEMKKINFQQVSLFVLDEADRMLDMGFEPQIRKIVNEIPPRRQTLMFTATWPKEVRKIASELLVNPVQVNIGNVDELAANKAITQYVEVVPQMAKQRRLEQILSQERGSKVIIFCSTKRLCDQLARGIGRTFGAAAIHGDKSQGERDWVLNQFRNGKAPILVATDVAARGLDVKDIRVVINYDFPNGIEDYVHRIGRTGRAGATGIAYTFFCEQDWKYAGDLIKVLEGAEQLVPSELRDIALRGGPSFGKDRAGGMSRFDSGGVASGAGGRWDSGGRGAMRDGGFGGRGGMRDGGFGDRGGVRDGGFGGRGGMREGGFGGHGGGMMDGGHGGRGGDFFPGRGGNRGRGFGGPGGARGGRVGWDRNDRGSDDRYSMDGRGRGRGRGRFDNRRGTSDRGRGRSYSPSPERVRTWGGYSRSRSRSSSRSRSRGRSRSRSWSRSRSRSWSRSRSRSRNPSRSRSRSRSRDRSKRRRVSGFDVMEPAMPAGGPSESNVTPELPASMNNNNLPPGTGGSEQLPVIDTAEEGQPITNSDPLNAPPSAS